MSKVETQNINEDKILKLNAIAISLRYLQNSITTGQESDMLDIEGIFFNLGVITDQLETVID